MSLTLFSYPELFGAADNNPYGLKIFAFLKLARLAFNHAHVLDVSQAPRGQLPYIADDASKIGDSDIIIAHLTRKHALTLDAALAPAQRVTDHFIRRTLDDLYWVMSYSRWKDERFWPQFRDALLHQHPDLTAAMLEGAQQYNFQRYHYQGIGRYEPADAYARGIADLVALASVLGDRPCLFGDAPCSTDAGLYGFIANIHFYPIETPLKQALATHSNLVAHCERLHAAVAG